jgi:hypothetical protein
MCLPGKTPPAPSASNSIVPRRHPLSVLRRPAHCLRLVLAAPSRLVRLLRNSTVFASRPTEVPCLFSPPRTTLSTSPISASDISLPVSSRSQDRVSLYYANHSRRSLGNPPLDPNLVSVAEFSFFSYSLLLFSFLVSSLPPFRLFSSVSHPPSSLSFSPFLYLPRPNRVPLPRVQYLVLVLTEFFFSLSLVCSIFVRLFRSLTFI